jgi:hypothetical protein
MRPLHAATDRTLASTLDRSPGLGFALRFGAAMLPLVATVALAIAALPLYRLHLPRHAASVAAPRTASSAAPRTRERAAWERRFTR